MTCRRSGRVIKPRNFYAEEQAAQANKAKAQKPTTKKPTQKKTAKTPAPEKTAAKPKAKKTAAPKTTATSGKKRKKAQANPEEEAAAVEEEQPPKRRSRDDDGEQVEPESEHEDADPQDQHVGLDLPNEPPAEREQPPANMTADPENQENSAVVENVLATPTPGRAGSQPVGTDMETPMLGTPVIRAYLDARVGLPENRAAHQDTTDEDGASASILSAEAVLRASAAATAARQSPPKFGPDWRTGMTRNPPRSFTSLKDEQLTQLDPDVEAMHQTFADRRAAARAMQSLDDEDDEDDEEGEGADDEAGDDDQEDGQQDEEGDGDEDGAARLAPEREPSPKSTYKTDPEYVVYTGTNATMEASQEIILQESDDKVDQSLEIANINGHDGAASHGGSEAQDAARDEMVDEPDDDEDLVRMLEEELGQASGDEQGVNTFEARDTDQNVQETSAATSKNGYDDDVDGRLLAALGHANGGDNVSASAADSPPHIEHAVEANAPTQSTEPPRTTASPDPAQTTGSSQHTQLTRSTPRPHHTDVTRPPPPFDYYNPNRRHPRHQRSAEQRRLHERTENDIDRRGRKWSPDLSSPEFEEFHVAPEAEKAHRRRQKRQQRQGGTTQTARAPPAEAQASQAPSVQVPAPQPPATPEIGPLPNFPEPTTDEIARSDDVFSAAAQAVEVEPPASPSPPTSTPPATSPQASSPLPSISSETFRRPTLKKRDLGSTASSTQNSPTIVRSPQSPTALAHDEGQTRETEQGNAGRRPCGYAHLLEHVGCGTFQGPTRPQHPPRPIRPLSAAPRERYVGSPVQISAPTRPSAPFAEMLADEGVTIDGEQITSQPAAGRPQYVPQVGDDQTTLEQEAAAARKTTRPGSGGRYASLRQAPGKTTNPDDLLDPSGIHSEYADNDSPDEVLDSLGLPSLGPDDGWSSAEDDPPADGDAPAEEDPHADDDEDLCGKSY